MSNSLFVVFEGIDGCGKSTAISLVSNVLKTKGIETVLLKEPTDGIFGQKIRILLKNKCLPDLEEINSLFIKDREEDVKNNIIPALEKNRIVLMDRYIFSNMAYQGAMGFSPEKILEMNIEKKFPFPDLTFLFSVKIETAIERIENRTGEEKESFEKTEFLKKVQDIYDSICNKNIIKIIAEDSREKIASEISMQILGKYNLREKKPS